MFQVTGMFRVAIAPLVYSLFIALDQAAIAQVIPDATLGSESSRLNPNVEVQGQTIDILEGGARRGANLFHSFQELNVQEGQGLYFANPNGVENIFSRVTGRTVSNIDGVLGVAGRANLFLLNPNGVVFGRNAVLDIAGSFVTTTGDRFLFPDRFAYSASNPLAPPLLTVNVPVGVQFGAQPGSITNLSPTGQIFVPKDQSLVLMGGNISLDGGVLFGSGSQIELSSVSANGRIDLVNQGSRLTTSIPEGAERGSIILDNGAQVFSINGDIRLQGGNLSLRNNSRISTQTNTLAPAGNIQIQTSNSVSLAEEGSIGSSSRGGGSSGTIQIQTRSLSLQNSLVSTRGFGTGNGNDINIRAMDNIDIDSGVIRTVAEQGDSGRIGDITIETGLLNLTNGGRVDVSSLGSLGDAGRIAIGAREVNLSGFTTLQSSNGALVDSVSTIAVDTGGNKDQVVGSGQIIINTDRLRINNGADISADVLAGRGQAGHITVRANESIEISGTGGKNNQNEPLRSGITASLQNESVGAGGNIQITTPRLNISNSGNILAMTSAEGNAGTIQIDAGQVALQGRDSVIATDVDSNGQGNSGTVVINSDRLTLRDEAQISSRILGSSPLLQSQPGSIRIQATDLLSIEGSGINENPTGIFSVLERAGSGTSSDINVQTRQLRLSNNGSIATTTFGQGNAGNLLINALQIDLSGEKTAISTQATSSAQGNSGALTINTNRLRISDRATITSDSFVNSNNPAQGRAGNIDIQAIESITLVGDGLSSRPGDATTISSSLQPNGVGSGGNIQLQTQRLNLRNGAQITTSTQGRGNAGNLNIQANQINLSGESLIGTDVNSRGQGNAGDLTINAQRIQVRGSTIQTTTAGIGDSGNLQIQTDRLLLQNRGGILTSTEGRGQAGNLVVLAENIEIQGANQNIQSGLFSAVEEQAIGRGGNIRVDTERLTVRQGGAIVTRTAGEGRAGNIAIHANEFIMLDGLSENNQFSSALSSRTRELSQGRGGDITVVTDAFQITDGAIITSETRNASRGGNIRIRANALEVTGGAQILASTSSAGQAGIMRLNGSESITLSGNDPRYKSRLSEFGTTVINQGENSSFLAGSSRDATGQSGSITLNTPLLNVLNGAEIAVDSQGQNQAGNINIASQNVRLNRGIIGAESASSDGGNIQLRRTDLLLMQNGSQISTSAGTNRTGGNGGNITINTNAIAALPNGNSNIQANAFEGDGGNIQIETQALFGIAPAEQLRLGISSITASSDLGVPGNIQITTPDVNPAQDIIELPSVPLDASSQIAQVCPIGANASERLGNLTVTGRGGLPPNPSAVLEAEDDLASWVTATAGDRTSPEAQNREERNSASTPAVVEAQGWVINSQEKVVLTATVPLQHQIRLRQVSCSERHSRGES